MSRRVSKPAAALLALVIALSAPSAFAASRSRDTWTPGFGPKIIKIFKSFAKKFGIVSQEEDYILPTPPKP